MDGAQSPTLLNTRKPYNPQQANPRQAENVVPFANPIQREGVTKAPSYINAPLKRPSDGGRTAEAARASDRSKMAADLDQELVDAKIAAASARTDVKLAELNGRLDLLLNAVQSADQRQADRATALEGRITELRSETIEGNRGNRNTSIAVGIGVAGIIITTIALLPSVFGIGMQVRDVVRQEISTAPVGQSSTPSSATATSSQATSPQITAPSSTQQTTAPTAGSGSGTQPSSSR